MRLVDADKIEPHEQLESFSNGQAEFVMVAYMDDIDALPTVDAVPVVHGRWIEDIFCSECGWCNEVEPGFIGSVNRFNFCPNCGARNIEGDDET